jgi:hypothetical protein
VLAAAVAVTAAFFLSFWGRNAAGLGRHDMGIALSLSFAVPLSFYASLLCAAGAAAGTIAAFVRGRAAVLWLAALAVALLPTAFFLATDAP